MSVQELTVSPSQVIDIVHGFMRSSYKKVVVFLQGNQGTGKTESFASAAASFICDDGKPADFLCIQPQTTEPTDLLGHPVAHDDGNGKWVAEHIPYGILQRILNATRPLLVLIDDIGHSTTLVQAALWQMVRNRAINGQVIPDCVTFALAGNRASDRGTQARTPATPLTGRSQVYVLAPSIQDWTTWARQNSIPEDLIMYAEWHPEIITGDGDLPKAAPGTQSPTPRTVADLGFMLRDDLLPEATMAQTCAGSIGASHGVAYYAFRKLYKDLPDVQGIVDGTHVEPPPEDRPDIAYALCSRLAVEATPDTIANITAYILSLPNAYAPVHDRALKSVAPDVLETEGYVKFAGTLAQRRRHNIN